MKPRRKSLCSSNGFTLLEVLVATAIGTIIAAGTYALFRTGTILSIKSLAGSSTLNAGRLSLDRANQLLQLAYNNPTLIDHTGQKVTGNGPAAGVRFLRYIGAPYVVTIPSGGLLSTATSMSVTRADNAQVPPPTPEPNDVFIINTTAMASGTNTQVMAYVQSVSKTSSANNRTTFSITFSKALGTLVTSDTQSTVTSILVRPTALVVKPTANGRELRFLKTFPATSAAVDVDLNPVIMTDMIALAPPLIAPDPAVTDTMADDNAKPFSIYTVNNRIFIKMSLRIRSNRYQRALDGKEANNFDTFMKVESIAALKCNQN